MLRALLVQAPYTIRSERLLMEQLDCSLLFRWFVGLNMDDAVWVPTVFSKNRDGLQEADISNEVTERTFFKELRHQGKLQLTWEGKWYMDFNGLAQG